MKISACNRLEGKIAEMKKGKATTNIRLTTDVGDIAVVATSSSVEGLALAVGDRVSALFREVDIILLKGEAAISTNNRFVGRVLDIKKGNVTVELPLDVGGGRRIVAVIARTAAEEMGIGIGDEVTACVREGDMLLVKEGSVNIRNRLVGSITNLRPGTVTTELTIATQHGEIYALLARSVAEEMQLSQGDRVTALLRERDFIVER